MEKIILKNETILTKEVLGDFGSSIKEIRRKRSRLYYNIISFVCIFFAIMIFNSEREINLLTIMYMVAVIYFVYILLWNNTKLFNAKNKKLINKKVSYEFYDDKVKIINDLEIIIPYNHFSRFIETDTLWLLECEKKYFIINKDTMSDKENKMLRKILEDNIK